MVSFTDNGGEYVLNDDDARHGAQCVNSFQPHGSLTSCVSNSRGSWDLEQLGGLSRVVQLGSGRSELQTRALGLQGFRLLTVMFPSSR